MSQWTVYMLECNDGSYYTGITTDTVRRLDEHNNNNLGAKYTRARRPVKLVYEMACENRSDASKLEYKIRKLDRNSKLKLMKGIITIQQY
ncbi:MAG: GIY-YIG nuclease family protein [Gammaproteobacteria bacterium]|nr:GIY-YIG nuclease family protein [Gammaproteobacteria bacterium]